MCECQSLQLNPIADVARCDWPIDGRFLKLLPRVSSAPPYLILLLLLGFFFLSSLIFTSFLSLIRCCPDLPLCGSPAPLLSIDQDLSLRGSPAPLLSVDQDWKATVVRLIFYEKKVEASFFSYRLIRDHLFLSWRVGYFLLPSLRSDKYIFYY
ncbi:unnamed protein product [Coffea canephora]|uniref:DH200=94 genomic scaffold, scaffold_567 n=1 Tax=Coffea canephora TaxID=49390 RepID=A0A068VG78_COFCA|nr:unnamed protein product [Coffea canephora]